MDFLTPEIIINIIGNIFSLGLGAVVAVVVLIWKFLDDRQHRAELIRLMQAHEQRVVELDTRHEREVTELATRTEEMARRVVDVVERNAAAMTTFTETLNAVASLTAMKDQLADIADQVEQQKPRRTTKRSTRTTKK